MWYGDALAKSAAADVAPALMIMGLRPQARMSVMRRQLSSPGAAPLPQGFRLQLKLVNNYQAFGVVCDTSCLFISINPINASLHG
jgi:hypothetical protein